MQPLEPLKPQASNKPFISQSPIVPLACMSLSISVGYLALKAMLQAAPLSSKNQKAIDRSRDRAGSD
jgi:hypothetical protein